MAVNKVVFNGDALLDLTGDTLTVASQLLSGIKAHTRTGAQITGTFAGQTKSATPSTSAQNITPDTGKWLSRVTVGAIPGEYIVPSGTKTINANGTGIDVKSYANVDVNVPIPSGYVDLSTLKMHCTQYNSDEFASKGSRIDSVSITVGFQPKIFLVRNNAAVRGTSSTANKYWMLSSLMVYDDAGHVHHRTSFVYYSGSSSSYKYAGGQSNTNYFEPTATGVQGVGTGVYMNDNETGLYSWYAWG